MNYKELVIEDKKLNSSNEEEEDSGKEIKNLRDLMDDLKQWKHRFALKGTVEENAFTKKNENSNRINIDFPINTESNENEISGAGDTTRRFGDSTTRRVLFNYFRNLRILLRCLKKTLHKVIFLIRAVRSST